jgi:hypothetical protein
MTSDQANLVIQALGLLHYDASFFVGLLSALILAVTWKG